MNECEVEVSPCNIHQTCINTVGEFSCECKKGLYTSGSNCIGTSYFFCPSSLNINEVSSDIDECDNATSCPSYATCVNTVGSYNCTCITGLKLIGDTCEGMKNVNYNKKIF